MPFAPMATALRFPNIVRRRPWIILGVGVVLWIFLHWVTRFSKDYDLSPIWPHIPPDNCNCISMREVVGYHCNDTAGQYTTFMSDFERLVNDEGRCLERDPIAMMPGEKPPLLVMTTTVGNYGSDKDSKFILHRGAAATLAVLRPSILAILDVTDEHSLRPDPMMPRITCPTNHLGTPRLKSLFRHAERIAERLHSPWAGFMNADIAIDSSLITVLDSVMRDMKRNPAVLIVGQRLNMHNAEKSANQLYNITVGNEGQLHMLRGKMRHTLVDMSHANENYWMGDTAMDFFFFKPGTFVWDDIPEFVVGRVGWDSWIVQWAIDHDVKVIDATPHVHAAHLTGNDGNTASWITEKKDKFWNYCAVRQKCEPPKWRPMISKGEAFRNKHWENFCDACFRCRLGSVTQAPFHMVFSHADQMLKVFHRGSKRVEFSKDDKLNVEKMLKDLNYPVSGASQLLANVKDDPDCFSKKSCCSLFGQWAVGLELEKRLLVRNETPGENGYSCANNLTNITIL
eukprot:m.72636 g.72636  ORF g.72636 m.72636 type:complete len:512 (+) comp12340_c0_seq2:439-1974(+)